MPWSGAKRKKKQRLGYPAFVVTWVYVEIIILSEVSQTEKDKYHVIYYMWNLKKNTNEFIYKTEIDPQT